MNQHEYVAGVLQYYKDNDIVQGDPNEGPWEEAHYPLPRGMGDEVILLKPEHHFIQGILQSEDVGRCCFWSGKTKKFLQSEFVKRFPEDFLLLLTQLYDKWSAENRKVGHETNRKNGTGVWNPETARKGAKALSKEARSKGGRIAGKIAGQKAIESGRLVSMARKGGRVQGPIQGRKNVESGHLARIGAYRYRCLVTGFISSAGSLARYQKARGIDTSLKERVY